jgi:hypothetical protein
MASGPLRSPRESKKSGYRDDYDCDSEEATGMKLAPHTELRMEQLNIGKNAILTRVERDICVL